MSVDFHRAHNFGISADIDASKTIPALLEPVMALEMVTPVVTMGVVVGDRSGLGICRSKVWGRTGLQNLTADVPHRQKFGYASDLRSATQGRATFSTQFDHHALVPAANSKEVAQRVQGF